MDDLISRQVAYEVLSVYYHHSTDVQHNALREALNKVPSAQPDVARDIATIIENEMDMRVILAQPEIIRCKDCKWWNHNTDLTYCDRFGTVWVGTDPDDFCSFAERETDE